MNDRLLCGTQLRFVNAPEGHGAPRETFQSVDSFIQIILSKYTRTLMAVLDISHENSEVKPTPAGEDGNICYENGETIDIPIVVAIMLRVRRAVVSICVAKPIL